MEERVTNIQPARNSRVEKLRTRIIDAPQEVCIERMRYFTESMKKNWDLNPKTRMSMALENVLNNITAIIRDGEIIVGCRTSKLKGAPPKANPGGGTSGAPAQAGPAYAASTPQRAPVTGKPSWAQ